ncbi:MAG: hypothetical protein CVU05_10415 [Bacteroidetes bacterium HGW-Bacteroidetes-21]|jgi:ferric-dicitrate binding protein FerR (iron transport regulator)|nr:MAG: hypothetical protein CVU05_10415 [Bacteroidetes bacterium HGW-Bacteroidetes-21]
MKAYPENINPDLLIAYLNGETSPEDSLWVKEWIEANPENQAHFKAFQDIWHHAAETLPLPADVNTDIAWQKLNKRINSNTPVKRPSLISFTLKVAAVIIPLIIIGYIAYLQFDNPKMLSIQTVNNDTIQQLADGSEIHLNKNSTLFYPEKFKGDARNITLNGEAFLNVTPDPEHPFIITAGDIQVRVVGTSFNIHAYQENETIEVFVKTGKVMLYTTKADNQNTDTVYLTAGYKGVYNKQSQKFDKTETTNENEIYWINKTLVFNKTRLESVFSVLEKNFKIKVIPQNKEINDLKLTASFDKLPIEKIMSIIAESFNIDFIQDGTTFEFKIKDE